jgi:hypothetical protein
MLRGLDVLKLLPSDHLTHNEIAAAALADQGRVFNPQQQFKVSWPASPVVARAYLDQLNRDQALSATLAEEIDQTLARAERKPENRQERQSVSRALDALASQLKSAESSGISRGRIAALSDTLAAMSGQL